MFLIFEMWIKSILVP